MEFSDELLDDAPERFLPLVETMKLKVKKRKRFYFPVDFKKHPVSLLQEYCQCQKLKPKYEFYEIPQKIGIEYGCIVTVDSFIGEARAFSKKVAKHQAAYNLLWILKSPEVVGLENPSSRRFVSETGVICVHYGDRRFPLTSCFRNRPRHPPRGIKFPIKKVKWEDTEESSTSDEEVVEPLREKDKIVDEIDCYLSERFSKTKIGAMESKNVGEKEGEHVKEDEEKEREHEEDTIYSSEHVSLDFEEDMTVEKASKEKNKIRDEAAAREVDSNSMASSKSAICKSSHFLKRKNSSLHKKTCLRAMNPVGYLQEACHEFKYDPPKYTYTDMAKGVSSVCTIHTYRTRGSGPHRKEARRAAAKAMIEMIGF